MYQIPKLLKYKELFHVFSEKSDGNMANSINGVVYDFPDVVNSRRKFFRRIGVDINKTVCIWGVHGDDIVESPEESIGISMIDYKKAVKCDGFVTNKKRVYLFLLIADCIPLIVYDPVVEVVALVHAGWKGVDLEIAGKAVKQLKLKYKSKAENIIVGIGPCARKESFIKENPEQMNDPRWKGFINKVSVNSYSIDLVGLTKKQLIEAGIKRQNIIDCGIDTVTDKRFFSHVRDGNNHISRQGRFACVAGMV